MKILRPVIILVVLVSLGVLTYYAEQKRTAEYSVLSGIFENQPTVVAARTGGRVKRLVAREGQAVQTGDLLLELEPGPLLTELEALKSREEEARANLKSLQAGYRREDIQRQSAITAQAQASLDKLVNGYRPQEIAMAKHQLEDLQAKLAKAQNGPRREELARAQAQQSSAQAALDFAQAEFRRYQQLYNQGAVSRQLFERAKESLQEAQAQFKHSSELVLELQRGTRQEDLTSLRAQVAAAQEQLSLLLAGNRQEDIAAARAGLLQQQAELQRLRAGNRPEDIAVAQAAYRTAKLNTQAAQEKIKEFKVVAPLDGIVERELVAAGELTNAGTPLMRLASPSDIWLKVYLAENKLALVKVQDKAVLQVDGIPEPIEGYVESIATTGEFTPINLQTPEERGGQVFALKLRLRTANPQVKAGMAATVKSVGKWQPYE